MDQSGRKRVPLAPLSLSSSQKYNKRRSPDITCNPKQTPFRNSDSAITNSENINRITTIFITMFDQLELLDTSRTNWKIKVRITRMWDSVTNDANETLSGYNVILLNDDIFHIQGFIYPDKWNNIDDPLIQEGGIYIITNFNVKQATSELRPVSYKYIINFSNSTTIEKVVEDDFMIPTHKFEFVDLGDLFDLASTYVPKENLEYAIDIIGMVEKFERLHPVNTKYGERNIVKFKICDARNSHSVTAWGRLAETTNFIEMIYNNLLLPF